MVLRLVADVFGRPAERAPVADAAGLGAAVCAAVGHGVHPGFEAAVGAMCTPGEVVLPDLHANRAYEALLPVYAGLSRHTDPVMAQLAALRTDPRRSGGQPSSRGQARCTSSSSEVSTSAAPVTARPVSSRATGTRKGEQDT